MNQLIEKISDEIQSTWRFRWWALTTAGCVAVIGWLVVFALPDRYEAYARVFVDTRTALKPVLAGLTVEQDVNAQLSYVRQSLLAGAQLEKIAEESGIMPATTVDPSERAVILSELAANVELSVTSASDREEERNTAGSVYGISYRDGDRERALRLVDVTLNTLVEQTLGGKRGGAESAQRFLETQIRDYERRLREAEDRLAEFKRQHIGLLPTEQGGYFKQLQDELDAASKLDTQLMIAISRRGELAKQLRGESVISASSGAAAVVGASGVSSASDTLSRIKETQARLDDLLLRFTDKHPDVVATRTTLEELRRRRQEEIANLRRGDADAVAASGAGSNPVYQSIQLALNQADVEIAALRGQIAQHRTKSAELRQRLDTAPKVEAEFAQLNRDYDVNKTQYTALLANYEKSRLGEQADVAGSVRFEIVQPPTAGYRPVSPQRGLLLAAVLVGAIAIGTGVAFLLHMLRPVVGSSRSLAELTGLPVLCTVSDAFPERGRAAARRDAWTYAATASTLLVGFVIVMLLNRAGAKLSIAGIG
jgi:polysaccharide chain length determinant protein (PEP-CTERM system associated)